MDDDKSKLEGLSDTLYSRTKYQSPLDKRSPVGASETPPVEEKWQSPALDDILSRERLAPPNSPFMKKFFAFALLFFVATMFVAGLIFFGGTNFISSKNVDITVLGPTNVSAGQMLELGVTIKNENNSDLELANFSVVYPQGSRNPEDSAETLTFTKEELGVIRAGDEAARNVRVVIIGSTGEVKQFKFSVEYKVKGSNATFYKDKIYDVTIGHAPLSLTVESPATITSGDTFTTTVSLILNSTDLLRNVMLRAEYPYGYSVIDTAPEAITDNNVWVLGDFPPGGRKKVTIRGKLVGENQEERTFRFYVGVSDNASLSPDFKSVIVSGQETVKVERPSIGLSTTFNGENAPIYIAPASRPISVGVRFQNNLPEKITNPVLELRLVGPALDKSTVTVQNGGVYDSARNRIVWNLTNVAGVRELNPGEGGAVSFIFSSQPQTSLTGLSRDIALELSLSAIPFAGSSRPIVVSESRTVKIASQVTLTSKAYYSIGPFKNTGPIPPKVGEETTYTVILNAGNTQDDIGNAKVTAKLGTGVKWLTAKTTLSEDITYDEETNTVTWDLVKLSSGSGFSSLGREVAFQVAFTPTTGQIGTAPALVNSISFFGTDTISGASVSVTNPPVTTKITNDPAFIQGNDIVVR